LKHLLEEGELVQHTAFHALARPEGELLPVAGDDLLPPHLGIVEQEAQAARVHRLHPQPHVCRVLLLARCGPLLSLLRALEQPAADKHGQGRERKHNEGWKDLTIEQDKRSERM
jgi:hypothetical protein